MKVYYCDECAKKIKITSKAPRVVYSNGVLLCSKKCLYNYYEINFIPRVDLPEIVGEGFDDDESNAKKCCICGVVYKGHGNNAEPVKKGYCCDDCNTFIVLKARGMK